MKKTVATIAVLAATALAGGAASAQVGFYPGGLPGDGVIVGGPDHYPGHWAYGGPDAAPSNLPVAVHDARRAAFWGAYSGGFYRGRGFGDDRRLRADDIRRLRESGGDVILRRLDP
ncbi:MAG: hypothetical protein AAGE05_08415 [Pseudomonadota bacterium]